MPVEVSICIVAYQAHEVLQECLRSIYRHPPKRPFEIIAVDNGSRDGTTEMLQRSFPDVNAFQNRENLGYTRPMNQALRAARGQYILLINPDAVLLPNAIDHLVDFLESNAEVGICGPKVLNQDGTLQKPCRRSAARPWDVLCYFSGLAARYPHNRRFSGYFMGYMDENTAHEVEGVSGSCMLVRRQVIDQIGYLDEQFFAYQEDADFCFRARKAGWQIYYLPSAQVIHYGGRGGSQVDPVRSLVEWHRSYWRYYRKNLAKDYIFIFNWLYYAAMGFKLVFSLTGNMLNRGKIVGRHKP